MAEFNKKHGFKLIETETPPKVKTVYSFHGISVKIIRSLLHYHFNISVLWGSPYIRQGIKFSGTSERIKKGYPTVKAEELEYKQQIRTKLEETINLYLEL